MSYIISELHGQYGGKISVAEQMILQSKFGGADAVKVQLYSPDFDSNSTNGGKPGDFLSLEFDELKRLKDYADTLNIDFFASVFDEERLKWCLDMDMKIIKISNYSVTNDKDLCDKIVASGKDVIMSVNSEQLKEYNGKPPYTEKNVKYLYTEPLYPAMLENVDMPNFDGSFLSGYSDHTIGNTAAYYALSKGARIIEKHFTISHSWQKTKEKAHVSSMNYEQLQQIVEFSRGVDILKNKKLFQYES